MAVRVDTGTTGPGGHSDPDFPVVELAPRVDPTAVFARFWPHLKPLRAYLALIGVLVALGPALATATTWLFKVMIDTVVVPGDLSGFPRLALLFLAVAVGWAAVSFADFYLSIWTGERFILGLRAHLFAHLHRQAPDFLQHRSLGDILARLTTDVAEIEQLLLTQVTQALSYGFEVVFFTVALLVLDWRLSLAALIAVPGFLVIAVTFSRGIRSAAREKGRRTGGLTGVAEESLGNAALVRAYHRGHAEEERFAAQNHAGFAAQMAATRLEALFGPLTQLLQVIGVLMVIGLAVWEIDHRHITIGGMLAFVAYLGQLYGPIQALSRLSNSMFAANASAERVIELLELRPSITEIAAPRRLPHARGRIRFDNVGFTYPTTSHPTLDRLDFTVEPGQTLAIVGASGSGKSTIAKLLLRFYDPDSGHVSLDGVDLRTLSAEDLYRNICPVLQETLVFDASIKDNIAWGNPQAGEQDIVDAAVAADAHEFIAGLPLGYQTRVGQRGRLLSGGQRQRIALARALLRQAPVLILDEPSTGLDAHSTQRVLAPPRHLTSTRTTIIITHDLHTITEADRILFLDHGRITGTGTHTDLLATHPQYAALYQGLVTTA